MNEISHLDAHRSVYKSDYRKAGLIHTLCAIAKTKASHDVHTEPILTGEFVVAH